MDESLQAPPPEAAQRPTADKPSQLQTLGILRLISGILNCLLGLWQLLWIAGSFWLVFPLLWLLPAAFGIVVGILEIINATKLMANPIRLSKPAKPLAIMEIICIVNGAVMSLVVGILALVWYNDPKIRDYYNSQPGA